MEENNNIDEIEKTDNGIRDDDKDITRPFSVKDIKIAYAPIMLPSIIKRLEHKEISVPKYQRNSNLWSIKQKSRLIESILLKLPLPVFYFDVSDVDKWEIVDGLQRISTIEHFFDKQKGFALKNLEFLTHLNGKKANDLDRVMQRTIDET
ncbi:DUF262 domain-containing protein, partial [Bathymodiolus thermophilus thioautotrophic gill symbiont]